jgi:tetratricopeptide (TPR) repeat protein
MSERMRLGIVLVVALLVYGNTLLNGFTYDDEAYVLRNQAVKTFNVHGLFQPTRFANILRPVTFGSFAVDWMIAGPRPLWYHLVNVLLNAAVSLLVFVVLRLLLEGIPRAETIAFVSALVFAVHPIHTEAVASIVGRSEVLAAGFLLLAWLLHLRDRAMAVLACLVLALMSKESAAGFLLLVLAGDYARGRLKPVARYVQIAGTTALYLALFWWAKGGHFGQMTSVSFLDNPLASLPVELRVLNALRVAWKYLALQVYPATLSSDYSYNSIRLYSHWRHCLPALAATILLLLLWGWTIWTGRKAWALAGAIYLGGFAVTANVVIPTGTIMGERLAYLPSIGFCILVALVWLQLEKQRPEFARVVLATLVVALSARTVIRNRDWRDNMALFSSAVRAVPGSAKMHCDLGEEYVNRGQLQAAAREVQTALGIYPDYPDALETYGIVEANLGHDQNAQRLFEEALARTTGSPLDRDFKATNLAALFIKMGRDEEALNLLNQVIQDWGGFASAWSNRAAIHAKRGELGAARADAETALRLDPSSSLAKNVLKELDKPRGEPLEPHGSGGAVRPGGS